MRRPFVLSWPCNCAPRFTPPEAKLALQPHTTTLISVQETPLSCFSAGKERQGPAAAPAAHCSCDRAQKLSLGPVLPTFCHTQQGAHC